MRCVEACFRQLAGHPLQCTAEMEALKELRSSLSSAQIVVVKVGSSVVTRDDGMVALGRIGALVEQIAELNRSGKQVVLVASGAIGIGTGKLKEQAAATVRCRSPSLPTPASRPSAHRRCLAQAMLSRSLRTALHSSPSSLRTPSPPARAAAGQGGLMGLYDVLFSNYGLACGQVLVTEADFASESRLHRMRSTLQQMLELGAVTVRSSACLPALHLKLPVLPPLWSRSTAAAAPLVAGARPQRERCARHPKPPLAFHGQRLARRPRCQGAQGGALQPATG